MWGKKAKRLAEEQAAKIKELQAELDLIGSNLKAERDLAVANRDELRALKKTHQELVDKQRREGWAISSLEKDIAALRADRDGWKVEAERLRERIEKK